jgi:proteasome assembly chaperone (PAC2) family protein
VESNELRISSRPVLRRPVLITAFQGWNDGGQAATLAGGYLARHWGADRFADIDPEGFVDFQATRPQVSLDEGMSRRITWPENAFYGAAIPAADRDAVVMLGVEPNYRWRTFVDLTVGLARELDVSLVVTLGALLADVPHTRPAPVTGSATDERLVDELGLRQSRYEGPTGIVGVLHDACRRQGMPSVSLWAAVPHYVEEAERSYAEQVSEAVATDAETAAYVEELEQRADSLEQFVDEGGLPSGDSIAAELTRYLREREQNGGDDPMPRDR